MTLTCQTLSVKKPANITAITMLSTSYDCNEPCSVSVDITWQNIGGKAGSFEPAIVVNGVRTGSGASINLSSTQTHLHTFSLTGLTEANYTLCPDPN